MPATRAARVAGAVAAAALVLAELTALYYYKNDVQASFCGLAAWLRGACALGTTGDAWIKWVHHSTNSFVYMQLSCVVMFMVDACAGAELFTFVVLAHITKNLSKSFIASPRGFWFCTTGHAISCGSGYSLPSGHSMMSLLTVLFLAYRFKTHRAKIVVAGLLFELYTVFEVLYLGTHTPTDIIVGFSYAVFLFSLLCLWNDGPLSDIRRMLADSPEFLTLALIGLTALVYQLEQLENSIEATVRHPFEWQQNYEAYCQLTPGTAATNMRNSSAYEKTCLMIGLTVALFVRQRIGFAGDGRKAGIIARVLRTVMAFGIFTYNKALIKAILIPTFTTKFEGSWRYSSFLAQPILLLVVFPVLFSILHLGNFNTTPGSTSSILPPAPGAKTTKKE